MYQSLTIPETAGVIPQRNKQPSVITVIFMRDLPWRIEEIGTLKTEKIMLYYTTGQ